MAGKYGKTVVLAGLLTALFAAGCEEAITSVSSCLSVASKTKDYGNCTASEELGAIDFGPVALNTTKKIEVSLKNTGKMVLTVNSIEIIYDDGTTQNAFGKEDGDDPSSIDIGSSAPITLTYRPAAVGSDSGRFVVTYADRLSSGGEKKMEYPLKGEGVESSVNICVLDESDNIAQMCPNGASACDDGEKVDACFTNCPESNKNCLTVDFGEMKYTGEAVYSERKVKLINGGQMALSVSSTPVVQCPASITNLSLCAVADMKTSSEFKVQDPQGGLAGVKLGSSEEKILTLRYAPFEGGYDKGALQIASDDVKNALINVILRGTSLAPKICPVPESVDFGKVSSGTASEKELKLRSCGTEPLNISEVKLDTNTRNWFALNGINPSVPVTDLKPGSDVTVKIKCTPNQEAVEAGKLGVTTNDPALKAGKGYINLVCQGAAPAACRIKPSPMMVDFGKVAAGKTFTMPFSLINVGEDVCTVTEFKLNKTEYSVEGVVDANNKSITVPFQIPVSKSAVVTVAFAAPVTKDCINDGTLTVVNTSSNSPNLAVNLRGCGGEIAACKSKVVPTGSLNFGTVGVGKSKTLTVQVENIGTDDCTIPQVLTGNSNSSWFSIDANTPMTIKPRQKGMVNITCTPTDKGSSDLYSVNNLYCQAGLFTNCSRVNILIDDKTTTDGYCGGSSMKPVSGYCIPLLCTGNPCKIDPVPQSVDFGLITMGCASKEQVIKLYNNGGTALKVTDLSSNNGSFKITSAPATPFPIATGTSVAIKVKYVPGAAGKESGILTAKTDCDVEMQVPMRGEGTNLKDVIDSFDVIKRPTLDILWCIDNSGSMGEEQNGLSENFPKFMNYLKSFDVDYYLAVVTSEINEEAQGENGVMIYPGVFYQAKGQPRIIANYPPSPAPASFSPVASDPQKAFQANAIPGTCCSDEQEACLQAVKMALSEPNINDTQKNGGFLRKLIKLVVISMSDEDDQSDDNVDYYVDFLLSINGDRNTDLLSYSFIGGLNTSFDPAKPSSFPTPTACSDGTADAAETAYSFWKKIYDRTHSGLAIGICDGKWGDHLSALGLDAIAIPKEYFLSRDADPTSLTVKVNGTQCKMLASTQEACGVSCCYAYDGNSNSVVFHGDTPPPKGAKIDVGYEAQCTAP